MGEGRLVPGAPAACARPRCTRGAATSDEDYERLVRGEVRGLAERADLERRLVAALTSGCERVVAGYAPKAGILQ